MKRFGKKGLELRATVPLSLALFDVLMVDDQMLINSPARRRGSPRSTEIGGAHAVPRLITSDAAAATAFYDAAVAKGHEGVMAKALDAPYDAGSRGAAWLKIKRVHHLDLVVLAAEWGSGRRKGWLSNIHLGARNGDDWVMLGKTFKGMTDEMLKWQTAAVPRARGRSRRSHRLRAARDRRRDRVQRRAALAALSRRARAAARARRALSRRQDRGRGEHDRRRARDRRSPPA